MCKMDSGSSRRFDKRKIVRNLKKRGEWIEYDNNHRNVWLE